MLLELLIAFSRAALARSLVIIAKLIFQCNFSLPTYPHSCGIIKLNRGYFNTTHFSLSFSLTHSLFHWNWYRSLKLKSYSSAWVSDEGIAFGAVLLWSKQHQFCVHLCWCMWTSKSLNKRNIMSEWIECDGTLTRAAGGGCFFLFQPLIQKKSPLRCLIKVCRHHQHHNDASYKKLFKFYRTG